jgi:putative ABC transport system permease protein
MLVAYYFHRLRAVTILRKVLARYRQLSATRAERRRSFTILAALGAKPRQLGSFIWSEALLIVGPGAVCGIAIGFAVAAVLVKLLSGVFDPPPEALSVPWGYLITVGITAAVCTAAAVRVMLGLARKPDPMALRRE